jgi:endonuclease-3
MSTKLQIIFAYLKELFPNPQTELHSSTPFQFLVAVMLSAQATDIQVNKVTDKLFQKIKTPADLVRL